MIAVFNIENARMGDIGYRVNPEYWNMGITTEALKEVIRFIFENTELERINGRADVRNIASNKVLEKCGFVQVYQGAGNYQGKEARILKTVWKK